MFYGHFHELFPTVLAFQGVSHGRKTRYMFESYDQKLVVFTFKAIFMSYCAHFSGSKAIYMFESYEQKLVVFAFHGSFHELFPTVLALQVDYHGRKTAYMFE